RPEFFHEIVVALSRRGIPSVLLAGDRTRESFGFTKEDLVFVSKSEPHHLLFPRARTIVHSCGIGTSAEALASGVPQVPVPFANDQPDNAYRIEKLGVGRRIPWLEFSEERFFEALDEISGPSIAARAREVKNEILADDFSQSFDLALARLIK
ncbi:MAG: nucleotide disphospho-sugar-binding domain-containing protein, partial [Bdellovibrionota bacterium]